MNPGVLEVGCDNVDNDCDLNVDMHRVPTDYATLQDAVTALADGSEICVEPGTHIGQLDLSGRTLAFIGQQGRAVTFLDVGATTPMVTVDQSDPLLPLADVSFTGFTVTGADLHASVVDVYGGFASILGGGALSLTDVRLTASTASMENDAAVGGLLVDSQGAVLSLTRVEIDGVSLSLPGNDVNDRIMQGAIVNAGGGTIEMVDVSMHDSTLGTNPTRWECNARGLLLAATGDAVLDLTDVAFRDNTLAMDCLDRTYLTAAAVFANPVSGTVTGLEATGNSADLASDSLGGFFDFAMLLGNPSRIAVSDVVVADNVVSVDVNGGIYGGLNLEDGDLTGLTHHRNTLTSTDSVYTAALRTINANAAFVDVRSNVSIAGTEVNPPIDFEVEDQSGSLTHFTVAGNTANGGTTVAMALDVSVDNGTLTVRNGDITGNSVTADAAYGSPPVAGWLTAWAGGVGDVLTLSNVQLVDNTHLGAGTACGVLTVDPAYAAYYGTVDLRYLNFWNTGSETCYGAVSGTNGNISVDPLYVDVAGIDPTTWDLHLQPGSPAVDAGDPAVLDDDGSVSDLGSYGGPGGSAW